MLRKPVERYAHQLNSLQSSLRKALTESVAHQAAARDILATAQGMHPEDYRTLHPALGPEGEVFQQCLHKIERYQAEERPEYLILFLLEVGAATALSELAVQAGKLAGCADRDLVKLPDSLRKLGALGRLMKLILDARRLQ